MRHVERGEPLRTHDDIPEDVRQQVYAEEEQSARSKRGTTSTLPAHLPPIQITNVLPGHVSSETEKSLPPATRRIQIAGLRDVAVQEYCAWQQAQVRDEDLKIAFQTAADLVVRDGLDLEQLNEDQNPDFLVQQGVKRGIAQRFVSDIEP